MVLLYGENLDDAKVSVAYPGVKIDKTQMQPMASTHSSG